MTGREARALREAARHLLSLAENDRDAGHLDRGFLRAATVWGESGLPGHTNAARAAAELRRVLRAQEGRRR